MKTLATILGIALSINTFVHAAEKDDYQKCMSTPKGEPDIMYPGIDYNYEIRNESEYKLILKNNVQKECMNIDVFYYKGERYIVSLEYLIAQLETLIF